MPRIIVIGAANVDISATTLGHFRPYDSNPSRVQVSFGGVGRNIAHNLRLMGAGVDFVTVFGGDAMSHALRSDCLSLGMELTHGLDAGDAGSNYFVCINDERGEMQAGAADVGLMEHLSPQHIHSLLLHGDDAAACVADCNLREDTLETLSREYAGLLYVDATSAAKSCKINAMLAAQRSARLVVKANRLEAQQISGLDGDAEDMAARIIGMGAARVYITLGREGVMCHDGSTCSRIPSTATDVVNTTGAGDAFMAGMVMGELGGMPPCEAAQWGVRAARVALRSTFAVNPEMTIDELRAASE